MAEIMTTARSLLGPLLLAAVVGALAGLLSAGSSSPASATLEVAVVGGGRIVNLSAPEDSFQNSCRPRCRWEHRQQQVVRLLPRPAPGWRWAGWRSTAKSGCQQARRCALRLDSDRKITAHFRPRGLAALEVRTAGSGSGLVLSRPAAITCGADCAEQFLAGTTVDLVALPAPGSFFSGWAGAPNCGSAALCRVKVRQSTTIRALFTTDSGPVNHALTVYNPQRRRGTVASAPGALRCGSRCTQEFLSGTKVLLSAQPRPGYRFAGWFGPGCSGQERRCQLTVSRSAAISVRFIPEPRASTGASAGAAKVVTSQRSRLSSLLTVGVLFDLLQESRKHRLARAVIGSSPPP